jgi:hypothetical protein
MKYYPMTKYRFTILSATAMLGACAFVKEIGSSFDTYKPIAINGRIAQSDMIARARIYAKSLGLNSPSDSGLDYIKYDDFTYRRVSVVYSCDLAFADIQDTLKVGLRKCKALDIDPKTKVARWLDYGIDAPNNHRQAITDDFWYSMIDTDNPARDSILKSIDMLKPLSSTEINEYIQSVIR